MSRAKIEKLISNMVETSEMKSLMTPLFDYSGNSLDVSERLIWSNWQCTIRDGYKDYTIGKIPCPFPAVKEKEWFGKWAD